MSKSLIVLIVMAISSAVFADNCNLILAERNSRSLFRQVRRLNVQLLPTDQEPTLQQLYLLLKQEEKAYQNQNISAEFAAELRASQSKYYRLDDLDDGALTRFYLNALNALYSRAAREWRVGEIARLTNISLSKREVRTATFLLDSFLSPYNLESSETGDDRIEPLLVARPWQSFSWDMALRALRAFGDRPYYQFVEWSLSHTQLNWNEANRVLLALSRSRWLAECCHSAGGCVRCPHNRRWLRQKSS